MATTYMFGPFRLDAEADILFRGPEPIPLGQRAVILLRKLVERPGIPVSKDALIEAAWAGLYVEENNLAVQIAALRRVLGEEPGGERWIETLPRRGYRFVGPVSIRDQDTIAAASAISIPPMIADAPKLTVPDQPSIAVLPFQNMSGDPEQEYFADGMVEEIITALSRIRRLFVIARNSSFTYKGRAVDIKQVGRELGVRYMLEGSTRKSGNRIRVTAQLVEADTGHHVWAERYDRNLADIFAVQDEITEALTTALTPAIADAEQRRAMRKPPESLDAWAAYQRGLWHLSKANLDDGAIAQSFFQQAIDLDPSFAGGYSALALLRLQFAAIYQKLDLCEAQRSAEALARRAVALDGADAEARSCLGWALQARGDLAGALAEIERALAMSPNLAAAHGQRGATLIFLGRPKEGLPALERCMRLDPCDPYLAVRLLQVACGLYFSGEYEATIEAANRLIRSYPNFPMIHRWSAAALGQLGRTAEAKEALEKAISLAPAAFDMYVHKRVPWFRPEDHDHLLDGLRKAGLPR